MKSYAFCPISDTSIDENVTRVNAMLTVGILVAILFTQSIVLALLLSFDFFLRAIPAVQYSPISFISRLLVRRLPFGKHFVNAGPKIFAARVGLLFSSLIVATLLLSAPTLSLALITILSICAFLEGAFGFCVACQIYPLIYRVFYKSRFSS